MCNTKWLLFGLLLLAWPQTAQADTRVYFLDRTSNRSAPPSGSDPWLKATVDDGGSPGSVSLVIDVIPESIFGGFDGSENERISAVYFALDNSVNLGNVTAMHVAGATGTFVKGSLATDATWGNFDIGFEFSGSQRLSSPQSSSNNPTTTWNVTDSGGALVAGSFDSSSSGALIPANVAALVEEIGPSNTTAWVAARFATPSASSITPNVIGSFVEASDQWGGMMIAGSCSMLLLLGRLRRRRSKLVRRRPAS